MATYEYGCGRHRAFTVSFPIGQAPRAQPCPVCGAAAGRVVSAPALARTPRRLAAAYDRAGRSAEAPEVVSEVPGRRRSGQQAAAHPAHARLPRP